MLPNEDSRPAPKLKVVPPSQIPTTEPRTPVAPPAPTTPVIPPAAKSPAPSVDSRKSSHTWIMVGTILVAVVGIGFIPWDRKISRASSIEPNPKQLQNAPLSIGYTLKSLSPTNEIKVGDIIARTSDPQSEEKLIKVEQNIINTEASRKLTEGELRIANSQLDRAQANLRTAITLSEQSRRNVLSSPSVLAIEREVEATQMEQNSLTTRLRSKEASLETWNQRIREEIIGSEYPQVVEVRNQIDDLTTRISPLNAKIEQTRARKEALIVELLDKAEKDLVNLAEPNAAVVIAEREVQQVIQKGINIDRQLQEYKQEKKFLEQLNTQETIHKAEFNGVADLAEAQKYVGKKLTSSIEIVVYNPQNMLGKMRVSDAEYNEIKTHQQMDPPPSPLNVTFTLENGKEIKGKVQPVSLQSEGTPDLNQPEKRLHDVWITFNDPQEFKKGMTGTVTIMMREERIHNIVGREVSNVMPFFKPIFYWLSGGR